MLHDQKYEPSFGDHLTSRLPFRRTVLSISTRLAIFVFGVFALSFFAIVLFDGEMQHKQAEREMLEKSQLIARQMNAAWDFIEINQDRIDIDLDGTYNFKGIYCAIAGKSIAARFTQDTDYVLRYISERPRKKSASPDEFEAEAFSAFKLGNSEYYGLSEYKNKRVFRYITPLYVEDSCLDCHGSPAGEIDLTGYEKEGLQIGDLGGAISIVMPIDLYMSGIEQNLNRQLAWFFVVMLASTIIIYFAMRRLIIKPILKLSDAAAQIESGNLDLNIESIKCVGEIHVLSSRFATMAQQVKKSQHELENKVRLRTEELATANDILKEQQIKLEEINERLREESQYKSDFLAIMSHELRTPLTSIIAFAEIWQESIVDKDSPEEEAVSEIRENAQRLLQMVNNILEVARFEEGRQDLVLEEIDLVDLFGVVERNVLFMAQKKEIELTTVIEPEVPIFQSDWSKLCRIVENLVSNAIKFSRQNGHVVLKASYDNCGNISLSVKDDGIGIKKEDIERIFERFAQGDNSHRRRYQGSGLGLAVVKDFVDLLGGNIDVVSTLNEGSEFIVTIPVSSA